VSECSFGCQEARVYVSRLALQVQGEVRRIARGPGRADLTSNSGSKLMEHGEQTRQDDFGKLDTRRGSD